MGVKRIYVLGTTEYAFMLSAMIETERQYEVVGHTCSVSDYSRNIEICKKHHRNLIPFEQLGESENNKVYILNAVGYSKMNQVREKMASKCYELGYEIVSFISDRATVMSDSIGSGNIVFPNAYIGTNVELGNNNVIYAGAVLTHDIVLHDNIFIAAGATIGGVVNIGNNCFIGMNATVKNRVEIANYTLVGAGVYVSSSSNEHDVIVPEKAKTLKKKSFEVQI